MALICSSPSGVNSCSPQSAFKSPFSSNKSPLSMTNLRAEQANAQDLKTVIITGAAGLVGWECVRRFAREGFKVVGIDNDLRQWFFGADASILPNRRFPETDFAVNAGGTLVLLEATRQFCPDAPFIFTSTNKVYGDTPNQLPSGSFLPDGRFGPIMHFALPFLKP
jgi:NAD dependent epimerase/dehydratase family